MIMINTKFFRSLLAFALLNLGTSAWAAQCTLVGGEVTTVGGCETEPTSYVVKIYKIGVCSAQPVAPTSGGAAADLSNCTTVFENASGSSISVKKGVSTVLSGAFTAPSAGTYSYAYAILDPSFQIQASVTFAAGNAQTVVASDGVTPVAGKGAGVKCWSLTNSYRESSGVGSDTLDCGSSFGTVGTVSDIIDILDGDAANPALKQSCVTPVASNMTGCVTDSALKQATGVSVTRLLMIYSGLTISYTSGKSLDLAFGVSSGVGMPSGGPGNIKSMVAGPLDISFSLK
jgi:hypothetical protein